MDMNLVAKLTAFLAPALPYLLASVKKSGEKVGEQLGQEVWNAARGLWEKLWPKIETREPAREAAADVATAPEDAGAQVAFGRQLEKLLGGDAALAAEIEASWKNIEKDLVNSAGATSGVHTQIAKNLANIHGYFVKEVHVGDTIATPCNKT